jgi:hypothetical protein
MIVRLSPCVMLLGVAVFFNIVDSLQPSVQPTRRSFFGAAALASWIIPEASSAVAPITQLEAETGAAKALRLFRSNPPKILRQPISLDFAVLLMRSSYAVTDSLDIIPMNQFQRDFFIIRSSEYEPYVKSLGPGFAKQGELTDPSYFDFISFAQYLTINRALSDPAAIFEELQPVGGEDEDAPQKFETVVVRRTIPDDQLVREFDERVGAAILKFMDDTYGDTPSRLPNIANRPAIDTVQASLTQLVKLFLVNGFAWDGNVDLTATSKSSADAAGATFCLTLVSPATVWGNQSLQRQRSQLRNEFLLKTAKQLVQRMGYTVASSSVKFEGNSELSYLTLR